MPNGKPKSGKSDYPWLCYFHSRAGSARPGASLSEVCFCVLVSLAYVADLMAIRYTPHSTSITTLGSVCAMTDEISQDTSIILCLLGLWDILAPKKTRVSWCMIIGTCAALGFIFLRDVLWNNWLLKLIQY